MNSQQEKAVSSAFLQLVATLKKGANEEEVHRAHSFGMRFIGARHAQPAIDQSSVKQKLVALAGRLNSQKMDSKVVLQVQDLLQKIARSKSLARRPEVLYLLLKLCEQRKAQVPYQEPIFREMAIEKQSLLNSSLNTTTISLSSSAEPPTALPAPSMGRPRESGMDQEMLLRDILYALQNMEGYVIGFENDAFRIREKYPFSESTRKMVLSICELGGIYRRINTFLELPKEGRVRAAFCDGVSRELVEYFRWIAVNENMLKTKELTLRRLALWVKEPKQRLGWILNFCEVISNFRGCQIISILNSYRPQGDPQLQDLVTRLISATLQPFLRWVELWVGKGQLEDHKEQYFIREEERVEDSLLWQYKYRLQLDFVPSVLSLDTANIIVQAGKTINFIKCCCREEYRAVLPPLSPESVVSGSPSDSSRLLSQGFKQWISDAHDQANEYLMKLLRQKHGLLLHLDGVKRVLLLGQGDFIQTLIEGYSTELNKPASEIYRHSLRGILEWAINSSNCKYLPEEVRACIDLKLEMKSQVSTGWDIFYLTYLVQAPIKAIISPTCLINYLSIFNFLWRLKLMHHSLGKLWKEHRKIANQLPEELSRPFHTCETIRHSMSHFVTTLFNYFMVVIEEQWVHFIGQVRIAQDLTSVLHLHETFLKTIQTKLLMDVGNRDIMSDLENVLKVINYFRINQDNLNSLLFKEVQRYKDIAKQARALRLLQREDELRIYQPQIQIKKLENAFTIWKDFLEKVLKLSRNLKRDELKYLAFQLDFSEYYYNQEIQKKNQ